MKAKKVWVIEDPETNEYDVTFTEPRYDGEYFEGVFIKWKECIIIEIEE